MPRFIEGDDFITRPDGSRDWTAFGLSELRRAGLWSGDIADDPPSVEAVQDQRTPVAAVPVVRTSAPPAGPSYTQAQRAEWVAEATALHEVVTGAVERGTAGTTVPAVGSASSLDHGRVLARSRVGDAAFAAFEAKPGTAISLEGARSFGELAARFWARHREQARARTSEQGPSGAHRGPLQTDRDAIFARMARSENRPPDAESVFAARRQTVRAA